eukprot:2061508-Alexandrium_andersonii.AAC.1
MDFPPCRVETRLLLHLERRSSPQGCMPPWGPTVRHRSRDATKNTRSPRPDSGWPHPQKLDLATA